MQRKRIRIDARELYPSLSLDFRNFRSSTARVWLGNRTNESERAVNREIRFLGIYLPTLCATGRQSKKRERRAEVWSYPSGTSELSELREPVYYRHVGLRARSHGRSRYINRPLLSWRCVCMCVYTPSACSRRALLPLYLLSLPFIWTVIC